MILKNVSAGTTAAQSCPTVQEVWVGISGTGSVAIEFQMEDGLYRSFPESTLTAPAAKLVAFRSGQYRFNVTGGPITIDWVGKNQ